MKRSKRVTALILAVFMVITPVVQTTVYADAKGFFEKVGYLGTTFTAINGMITFAGSIYDAVNCAIDAKEGEGVSQFFVGLLGKSEDQKLNGIESTVTEIDGKIDTITKSIEVMDEKLDGIMKSINELHTKLGSDVDKLTVTLYENQLQMQDWTSTYGQIETFYNGYSNVRTTLEILIKDLNARSADFDAFLELVAAHPDCDKIMAAVERLDVSCSNYDTLNDEEKSYLNTEFEFEGKTYTVYKYVKDYAEYTNTALSDIYNKFGADYSVNMYTSLQNMAASILGEKWQNGKTGIGEVFYKLAVMGSENSDEVHHAYREFTANVQYDFLLTAYICSLSLKSQIACLVQEDGNINEITTLRSYLDSVEELVARVLVYGDYEYQKCVQTYDFDGFVPAYGLTYDDYIVYYANPVNKINGIVGEDAKSAFISREAASACGQLQITNENMYLAAGESKQLKFWFDGEQVELDYTLSTTNDCVAVNADGTIVGLRPGSATIRISDGTTTKDVAQVTVRFSYAKYNGSSQNEYHYYKDGVHKSFSCAGTGYEYEYCSDISALEKGIDTSASKSAALSDVVPFDGTTVSDYEVFINCPYGKFVDDDNLIFSGAYVGAVGLIRTTNGKQSVTFVPIVNKNGEIMEKPVVSYSSNHSQVSDDESTLYIYTKEDLLNWKSTYDNTRKTQKVNVVLMNDIDMEWAEWSGIEHALDTRSPSGYADTYSSDVTFEHEEYTFDGNGYAIKNITFVPTESTMYYYNYTPIAPDTTRKSQKVVTYSMFSKLTGTVKNLTIENVKYADTTDSQLDDSWPRVYSVFASLAESEFQYMLDGTPGMQSFTLTSEIRNCVAKGTSQISTNLSINYDPFGNLLDSLRLPVTKENSSGTFSQQEIYLKNCIYDMETEISAGADSRIGMFTYVNGIDVENIYSNLYAGEITLQQAQNADVQFVRNLLHETQVKSQILAMEGSDFCGLDLSAYTVAKKNLFDQTFWTDRGWDSAGVAKMLDRTGYPTYDKAFTVDTSSVKGMYFTGEAFDKDNLYVYGLNGAEITDYTVTIDGDISTAGTKTVHVRYQTGEGYIYSGSFDVTYTAHVPVTFTYDNVTHTRYAEQGGNFVFPNALFTRVDGYLQNGWYPQGSATGTPIALGGTGSISSASAYVPSWRESAECTVVFGDETINVREGTVITVPAYNGYDANLYSATGWFCKDTEDILLQPGDQFKVTKSLTFSVQTEERFTTLRVNVLFQNVDNDEYTDLGSVTFDHTRHGENVSAYYQDAFEQLFDPYGDESRNWVSDCVVSVIPSNCLEDNSSGSTEYLVQADANSTVTIKIDRPVFEVEWLNIGGETIQTDTLRYGAMPSAPADGLCVSAGYVPVWDRDFSVVVADTSYQVEEEKPSTDTPYQVNHLCQNIEDDEYVLQETETMRGTTGEKTAAVAKSYDGMTAQTFTQVEIKGDGKTEINIYYNRNLYTVSWDIDGTVTTEEYKYGATPVYKGETPEKPSDVQYNYTFESWGEITPVTDHVTYNAVFTSALNKYGITWDIDGKTWTEYYDYGETPSYKGKTPERDADVQYTYTFKDWGEITPVTGDKTYTAIFDEILNKYTITWKVEDEEIEEIYEYGATPVYKGVNPVKLADVANTYAFNGWGQMEPVSGDKTYTAEFVSTLNKYTITWVVDGVQTTELYKYGTTPVYKGVTPTKAATPQYTYTFADWGEVTEVTGDKTYTANFEKSLNEYTITWNIDGMQTTEVYTYGDTPSYKGDTPVRAANAQYTYTFRDWGNLSKVTEDKTYTAVFDNKVNKYSITWIVDGKHFTEVYEYDELPTYKGPEPTKDVDAANTYAFNGWGQIEPVSGDKAYTAVFVSTANKYTVIWDVDGVKQSELYTYGDMPSYKWTEPTKASDGKYIYTFAGWGELEEVTGDKTYVASFDTAPVEYTITWDADGVKTTETYKYGDTPAFKGKTPARTADDQYTYKFAGWGDITNVECDKTYVAIFDATLNQYTITWDVDGDKVTELYNYGEMPTYKGVTPTRAADEVATYAFNGWGTIHKVTADCVYTATFIETSVREDLTNRATCTLSYRKIAYNGWKQTPEVTVTDPQNNILEAGKDYIVTYEDGCTEVGRYKITIDFIGAYRGTAAAYYTIVPKAPKKATAKLYGYDDVKVQWSETEGATGYYVYAKKENAKKYTLIRRTTNTSVKHADLVDGATYTFKILPFYTVNGIRYVSTEEKLVSVDTLKKVTKPVITKKGLRVKVKWKDIDGETGYQISKALKKNGTNIVATKNAKFGAYKMLRATKGMTYYYKVRAYKVVDGKKVFGPWSKPVAFTR